MLSRIVALLCVLLGCGVCLLLAQQQPPATYTPQLLSFQGTPSGPCDVYQVALTVSNGTY